jgi:putative transposase
MNVKFGIMKKSRFTESRIISILGEHEKGRSITDLCREYGISHATFYNWKGKYGGMTTSQLKKLKDLETENSKLKQMYADVSIQRDALKDVIEKKL